MVSLFSLTLFCHLLTAIMLACGNTVALAATSAARRAAAPNVILTLMGIHRTAVRTLIIPGAILVVLSGVALAYSTGMRLSVPWLLSSLVVWAISFGIGVIILVPAETQALQEVQRLLSHGSAEISAELRQHVGARSVVLGEWLQQILLVVLLTLMVFKPG